MTSFLIRLLDVSINWTFYNQPNGENTAEAGKIIARFIGHESETMRRSVDREEE